MKRGYVVLLVNDVGCGKSFDDLEYDLKFGNFGKIGSNTRVYRETCYSSQCVKLIINFSLNMVGKNALKIHRATNY